MATPPGARPEAEDARPRILLFIPHFLPGSRYGGPVRTVANLLARMGGLFHFHVLTSDHDFQSGRSYPLSPNTWLDWRGQAQVYYADHSHLGPAALARIGHKLRPDLVYLNSFFHPRFSLLPYQLWRSGSFGQAGLVLAPRGEFARAALAQKAVKKRLFLAAARLTGRYREPLWQASSPYEEADIRRVMGRGARIQVAPNLGLVPESWPPRDQPKEPGRLRLLFLGRVSRMKNLDFALECLGGLSGAIEFDVAGPVEDADYLAQCRQLAAALPPSSTVRFLGAVVPEQVSLLLRGHDLLFQPSLGENFGHAILEALLHGLPVLTSDRTPWRNLSTRHAGWDLPLENADAFRRVLNQVMGMDEAEWSTWSGGATRVGEACCRDDAALLQNVELFHRAMAQCRWGVGV